LRDVRNDRLVALALERAPTVNDGGVILTRTAALVLLGVFLQLERDGLFGAPPADQALTFIATLTRLVSPTSYEDRRAILGHRGILAFALAHPDGVRIVDDLADVSIGRVEIARP